MSALPNDCCPTCGQPVLPIDHDIAFDEFWAIYPARPGKRKLYKTDAAIKWKALLPAHRDAAMNGARALAKAVRDGYRYPIDAKRFLTHRRWEDWLEDAAPKGFQRPPWAPPNAVPDGQGGWQS